VAADASGRPTPPLVITAGSRAHLLFDVVPHGGAEPVRVTVGRDGGWAVAGVLGAAVPRELVAAALLERGVEALTGGLADRGGQVATITWIRA
jgi:hypothetical protein